MLGNVWRRRRRGAIVCAGFVFLASCLRISAVRSFHHSRRLSFLGPWQFFVIRESLLSEVSCLAQPWVLVHANDARNRGISIGARLEARLALCGLDGFTPMGRGFWAWKAPNFEDGHQQNSCRNSPVHGYKSSTVICHTLCGLCFASKR